MKANVTMLDGSREKVSLPNPHFTAKPCVNEYTTGISITGLFYARRTGKLYVQRYSRWDNRRGLTIGYYVDQVTLDEYRHYCKLVDCDPVI